MNADLYQPIYNSFSEKVFLIEIDLLLRNFDEFGLQPVSPYRHSSYHQNFCTQLCFKKSAQGQLTRYSVAEMRIDWRSGYRLESCKLFRGSNRNSLKNKETYFPRFIIEIKIRLLIVKLLSTWIKIRRAPAGKTTVTSSGVLQHITKKVEMTWN